MRPSLPAEPASRRYRRITMKILLSAAATAIALTALAGCSGDDDATPPGPGERSRHDHRTDGRRGPPAAGSYPEFEATDYTLPARAACYCPIDRAGQGHRRGRRGHLRR